MPLGIATDEGQCPPSKNTVIYAPVPHAPLIPSATVQELDLSTGSLLVSSIVGPQALIWQPQMNNKAGPWNGTHVYSVAKS